MPLVRAQSAAAKWRRRAGFEYFCYKSLPHQIRRVFERRNAQKPEFYGVRRFAKRNWNRRTQRYRHTLVRVWRNIFLKAFEMIFPFSCHSVIIYLSIYARAVCRRACLPVRRLPCMTWWTGCVNVVILGLSRKLCEKRLVFEAGRSCNKASFGRAVYCRPFDFCE